MTNLTEKKRIYQVFAEAGIIKAAEKNSKKASAYRAFGGRVVKTIDFTLAWNPDNFVTKDFMTIDIEAMIVQAYRDGDNNVRVHLAERNAKGFVLSFAA